MTLLMMRDGKGPSDVAAILGYPSRQLAQKRMLRAAGVAKFFAENSEALSSLCRGDLPLPRRQVVILQMVVLSGMVYQDVAEYMGCRKRAVFKAVSSAKEALRAVGLHGVVQLVEAVCGRQDLFGQRQSCWRCGDN